MMNNLRKELGKMLAEIFEMFGLKVLFKRKDGTSKIIIIPVLLIIAAYYIAHIKLSTLIPIILTMLVLNRILFSDKIIKFKISLAKCLFSMLVLTFIIEFIELYVFNGFNLLDNSSTFQTSLLLIPNIFKYFITSFSVAVSYILIGFLAGDLVLKKLRATTKISKGAYFFISLNTGLCILGIICFYLAFFSILNIYTILGLTALLLICKRDRVSAIYKFIWINKNYSLSLEISRTNNLTYWIWTTLIPLYIVSVLRSFTLGPDGLRAYLNIVINIAESGRLPTTYVNLAYPFGSEILFAPAQILGGIPANIVSLYTVGIIYILGFYLILRDFVKLKSIKDSWVLFPIIFFPPFLRMYHTEYKIDVFSNLLGMGVFYLTYLIIKHRNDDFDKKKLFYIKCFISGFLITIKIINILYIAPCILYSIYILFFSKKMTAGLRNQIKVVVIGLILFIIPLSPWAYLYTRDLPYLQNINTWTLTILPNTIARSNNNIPVCYNTMLEYEDINHYGQIGTGLMSYVNLPKNFLKSDDGNIMVFSILDIGLFFSYVVFMAAIVFLYKLKNGYKSLMSRNIKILFLVSVIPVVFWLIMTPLLPWYGATQILMMIAIIFIYLYKTEYNKVLRKFVMFISIMYILQFPLSIYMTFIPVTYNYKEIIDVLSDKQNERNFIGDDYSIAQIINADMNGKVLYTTGVSFLNLHFFEKNFFDRSLYYDYLREKDLNKAITQYNIKFIVINKITDRAMLKCLVDNTNYVENYVKDRKFTLAKTTKYYDVYRVD